MYLVIILQPSLIVGDANKTYRNIKLKQPHWHPIIWGCLIWFYSAGKFFPEKVNPGTRKFCRSYFSAPPLFTASGKKQYQIQHERKKYPHPPGFPKTLFTDSGKEQYQIQHERKKKPHPTLFLLQLYLRIPAKSSTKFNKKRKKC